MKLVDSILTIDRDSAAPANAADTTAKVGAGGMTTTGFLSQEWFDNLDSEAPKGGKKWQWGLLELLFIAGIAAAIFMVVKLVK